MRKSKDESYKADMVIPYWAKNFSELDGWIRSYCIGFSKVVRVNYIYQGLLPIPKLGGALTTYWYPYSIKSRRKAEILHTVGGAAYVLNFVSSKKTLVTCFDIIDHMQIIGALPYPEYKIKYHPLDKIWVNLYVRGIKKSDRVIAISECTKDALVKYLGYPPDKIYVVHLGVNHSVFKKIKKVRGEILEGLGISAEHKVILVMGGGQKDRLLFLIRSFYQLKKKIKNVKLIKVGVSEPKYREKICAIIEELGLKKDFLDMGRVPLDTLVELYNAVDLLVQPCIYDGWSLPVIEAMSCGTPVVISDAQALKEAAGGAAAIFDRFNTKDLTKAVYRILTDDGLRDEMSKKGLRRTKMFSWEKTAEETAKVYDEL
jgi:glycosyltransferase involved in cell wall biosynthesis